MSAFLDQGGAGWSAYETRSERFGSDEFVTVALRSEKPFDDRLLESVRDVSREFSSFPGVWSVDSIATVSEMRFGADGEIVVGAGSEAMKTAEDCAGCVAPGVARPGFSGWGLRSDDGRMLAVNIFLGDLSNAEREEIVDRAKSIATSQNGFVSGVPVFRSAIVERTKRELALLTPIAVAVVLAVIVVFFRSLTAVVTPVLAGGLGVLLVLGAMGLGDVPVSLSTFTLPPVLIALAAAYSLHVVSCGGNPAVQDEESLALTAVPVAVSGLTTAIGFLAMALVPVRAIQDLGGFGALGVLAVTVASLTLGPAVVRIHGFKSLRRQRSWETHTRRVVRGAGKYPHRFIGVWACAILLGGYGLSLLEFESDVVRWFPRGDYYRDSYEAIREQIAGITPVSVTIEGEGGRDLLEPGTVERIDAFTQYLRSRDDVGAVAGFTDPLRSLNHELTGMDGIPDDVKALSQATAFLRGGERFSRLMTIDGSMACVHVRLNENSSSAIRAFAAAVDSWWSGQEMAGVSVVSTGIMLEFARSQDSITRSQLYGIGFAAAVICIFMFILFGWSRLLVAVLVPNVPPIVIVYGALGAIGVPVDAATASIGAMAIGLAVDDSVHLGLACKGNLGGGSDIGGVERAIGRVAPFLVMTTIVVGLGFAVLGMSGFVMIRNLGLITGAIAVLCLFSDVTMMPAILASKRSVDSPLSGGRYEEISP